MFFNYYNFMNANNTQRQGQDQCRKNIDRIFKIIL